MSDVLLVNFDGKPLNIIPLSTITWQTAIKLVMLDKVKIVEHYDNWVVHSPSIAMPVPSIVMITKYFRKVADVKFNRDMVYLRDEYTCQYCNKSFHPMDLTIDHVIPKCFGGDSKWNNVVSSCRRCNHRKGDSLRIKPNTKPVRPSYSEMVEKRKKFRITVKDRRWAELLDWDENLVNFENNG